jgi:DNA-binding MarR family transcriptional regulator
LQVWKNGKTRILQALSQSPKTWSQILEETSLSKPVVDDYLKAMQGDGLVVHLPSESRRGAKYDITSKGREIVLRQEDRKFDEEAPLFRAYDLESYLLKRDCFMSSSERVGDKTRETKFYREPVDTPEQVLERKYPVFPLPVRAALRMSENATFAIEPWLQHMRRKQGITEGEDDDDEWLYKEVAYDFADPNIRKLCEVLFGRTQVLCGLYSRPRKGSPGEKKFLPTLDNILNFNFEVLFRYEGEKLLNSLSKEDRNKAEHLLAGTLLLYLGGSGGGPIETYVWEKQELEALVKSGLLSREEIQPLLDACELVNLHHYDPPREEDSAEQLNEDKLTDEQKRKLTISAYRRFYFADHQDYDKAFANAVPAKIGETEISGCIQIVEEREVEEWKNTDLDKKTAK